MNSVPPATAGSAGSPGPLPRTFGRYVLFDRIGRGGMADIYLARADNALGGSRLCVVKQILPHLGSDAMFERFLIEEAKLAARLTHANVVQVFDLGREGDRLYIGMEYVEGFDLNQLLRTLSNSRVALPAEFALFVMRETLRALDYAHRAKDADGKLAGLVHRDVSPSNVLVSFEGEVKLCDFGIARAFGAREERQHSVPPWTPKVVGKSAYLSPEHARGEPIDARADVFAAGILLWELAAGRRLYKGTEPEMLALARQAKVQPLPERGLPDQPKLQAVLDKALTRYRDDRFQSAADFLRALEDYAISVKLMASQLRFGAFLTANFAGEILAVRRERERAARGITSTVPPLNSPVPEAAAAQATPPAEASADDESPTIIVEIPARELGANVEPGTEEQGPAAARWNEPGSIVAPDPLLLDGAPSSVSDLPSGALFESALLESDLDRSLTEMSVIGALPKREPGTPGNHAHPHPVSSKDWLWYTAALFIVGAGVLAYLLR